jgi:hypothetical protein
MLKHSGSAITKMQHCAADMRKLFSDHQIYDIDNERLEKRIRRVNESQSKFLNEI